jgi:hypothetical protein
MMTCTSAWFRRLCALAIALVAIGAAAGPAAAQSAGEQSSAFPAVGAPGARFTFIASGFKSRERVAVWINTPDGRVITTGLENLEQATREGRVTWSWAAPEDAALGVWQFVAHGTSSNVERVLSIEIRERQPPPSASNIDPRQGHPGTLFTFYASGFLLDEDVRVWANAPDGTAVPIELNQKRLYLGRLDASWTAPLNAQLGHWQIVIVGVDSDITHVLDLDIGAPQP